MSNNFVIREYNITTSLTDNYVFIRVLNNISFHSYENTVPLRNICTRLPFEPNQIYDVLINCFNEKDNYVVVLTNNTNELILSFTILFDGIFKTCFNITLPEQKITEDARLTLNMNTIEIGFKREIDKLKAEMENMKIGYKREFDKLKAEMENMKIEYTNNKNEMNTIIHDGIGNVMIDESTYRPGNKLNTRIYKLSNPNENIKQMLSTMFTLEVLEIHCNLWCFDFTQQFVKRIVLSWGYTEFHFKGIDNLPNVEIIEIMPTFQFNIAEANEYYLNQAKKLKKIVLNSYTTRKDFFVNYCNKNNIEIEIM
jgi:hypothetical protein